MVEEISQLAQYGLAGVCIALIALIGLLSNRFFKYMGNHTQHETSAWLKNTEALTKLTGKVEEDIVAQKETTATLRGLQEVINNK